MYPDIKNEIKNHWSTASKSEKILWKTLFYAIPVFLIATLTLLRKQETLQPQE